MNLKLLKIVLLGMDLQAKKIAFMEEFLKIKDLSVVDMLTQTLHKATQKRTRSSIEKFAGVLNDEDAKVFQEASQECRKVDLHEW